MKPNPSIAGPRAVKVPPLLLGVTLLFWGWQTGFLAGGIILAVAVEGARFTKTRWDLSDEDFHRTWDFCTLLVLACAIFAFTSNEGPGGISGLFRGSAAAVGSKVSISSEHAATALLRWLPMILFPVVAAQAFSFRESVPVTAISLILRWRRRREQKRGRILAPGRQVDIFYPYFILCLFSAGIHLDRGDILFFWGQAILLGWALWPLRSPRYGLTVWSGALALAVVAGYLGQSGLGQLEQWAEGHSAPWLVRFLRQKTDPKQSMTDLGRIDRLKLSARIIIRLQPQAGNAPPTYLREASYRNFRLQTWYTGRVRNDFENLAHGPNDTTWVLVPARTNSAVLNIACYLPGGMALLPLPNGSSQLDDLNAYVLSANRNGAVLAEGPGLVIFDARFGPGETLDSSPNTNWDCRVPTNEMPVLDRVISEMKLSGRDQNETCQRVSAFFQDRFRYGIRPRSQQMVGTNETAVDEFLLHTHIGHCEYFATATTLLLRRLAIPARYAVGYAVHEPHGDGYVVRERDAHAWCLVWNEQKQIWEDFDTTPASWISAESQSTSSLQRISDFWSAVGFQIAKFRWGRAEWRRYFLWLPIPVLALLLYQILFRRGRKRRQLTPAGDIGARMAWPGLDSEFYQLQKKLAEQGVERRDSEPLSNWLARTLADPSLVDLRSPLQELLRLHYRYRFDPRGLNEKERGTLRHEAKVCFDALTKAR